MIDEDQKIVLFNRAAEELFRCPASQALGTTLDRFIPVEAREKHRKLVSAFGRSAATRRTMESPSLDLRCVRADGTEFRGEISISHHIREGRPAYAAIIRDATARLEAERTGAESETNWRSLFDNMLEGVGHGRLESVDGQPVDITWLRVNPAFETLTGLSDVVGKRISEVIPGFLTDNRPFLTAIADVAATGVPRKLEAFVPGLGRWFSVALYSPGPGEFIAVFDNITERRQAEDRIRRQLEHVSALRDIDRTLVGSMDLRVTLSGVVAHAIRELGPDAACILLLDTTMQTLRCAASAGFRTQALQHLDFPARAGFAGKLAAVPGLGQGTGPIHHAKRLRGKAGVCRRRIRDLLRRADHRQGRIQGRDGGLLSQPLQPR